MPQLLIRRIDEEVKENLRLRAKRDGVSMEEEARMILRKELLPQPKEQYGIGTQIAELFRGIPDNDEPFEHKLTGSLRIPDFDE